MSSTSRRQTWRRQTWRRQTWRRPPVSAFTALLALALCLDAMLPTAAQTPVSGSLAGQFLVAAPKMGDPRFERTVILMVRHDKDGAFGIVVNRSIGERPLAAISCSARRSRRRRAPSASLPAARSSPTPVS
jgi:hypothetical protein